MVMTAEQKHEYYVRNRERFLEKQRRYYASNREERLAYARSYKRSHPTKPSQTQAECHPDQPHFAKGFCQPCYSRDYYEQNKDKWRAEVGYAPGEYDRMLAEQDGKCYLCGKETELVSDHDHDTGRPRRLLCQVCNKALGMFGDDPELLSRAAEYVIAHKPLAVAYGI